MSYMTISSQENHHFSLCSYFHAHPTTLLLKILGGPMHGPSPHLKFGGDRPPVPPRFPLLCTLYMGRIQDLHRVFRAVFFLNVSLVDLWTQWKEIRRNLRGTCALQNSPNIWRRNKPIASRRRRCHRSICITNSDPWIFSSLHRVHCALAYSLHRHHTQHTLRRMCDRLTDWLTDWLTNWLTDWLTDWRIDWLTNWLTDWLTDWRTDWLTNWLADWLTDWRTDWLTN